MNGAVFTISRVDQRSTDNDSDLLAVTLFRESVPLTDSRGATCVNPSGISIDDVDYVDGLRGGGISRYPVRHRVVASIPCNYLSASSRQRLLEMMLNRERVEFSPWHEDGTILAWRPGLVDTDLVGNSISRYNDATRNHVWDDINSEMGVMRKFGDEDRIIKTPFGAGFVGEGAFENEALPAGYAYPRSGDYGWAPTGGSPPTLSFNATGFGHVDCLSTVRVVGGAGLDNWVAMELYGIVPNGSTDRVEFGVFLKGVFPPGSSIYLRDQDGVNNEVERVYFDDWGYEFGDWTMVRISAQKTWVAGAGYDPRVYLHFDNNSDQRAADFEIGPSVLRVMPEGVRQSWPHWTPAGANKSENSIEVDVDQPQIGSLHYAFYVPEWLDERWDNYTNLDLLVGLMETHQTSPYNNTGKMTVTTPGLGDLKLSVSYIYYDNGAGFYNVLGGWFDYKPGSAVVLSFVFGQKSKKFYADGVLIQEEALTTKQAINLLPGNMRISRHGYGAWPLVPLGVRYDRRVHSQKEVSGIARAITAEAASGACVSTRGRKFMIRAIPSSPAGGFGSEMHFSGSLELEQVVYDSELEDVVSKEEI